MVEQQRYITAFGKRISLTSVLSLVKGTTGAPTIVFFAGIHGNEFAGVVALQKVIDEINLQNIEFEGNFYAITGNLKALEANKRFIDVDLNRIWTKDQIETNASVNISECAERNRIYKLIKEIEASNKGPFYFIDLHTTSSETEPFITISDSLNNRKFSRVFSVPTILGIEEYLDGPLLTFINEFGHVALGFEAGQHDKQTSVDNCIAFIWLALEASACLKKSKIKDYEYYQHSLSLFDSGQAFFDINYRYQIAPDENFKMIDGFVNFEEISRGQHLALSGSDLITAPLEGRLFMPLYQNQGDDGFFIISKISKFWLHFSILIRKLQLHHVLRILPGVSRDKSNPYALYVNPKTARFLAAEIFHLFGFRKKTIKNDLICFIRRDRKITKFS